MAAKIALFPGSFDPIHEGHINIIQRGSKLFDILHVVVSNNLAKKDQKSLQERYEKVCDEVKKLHLSNVKVHKNDGITITFAKKLNCQFLLRSIRDPKDLDYELDMAKAHYAYDQSIETVLLIATPELQKTSSTNIKALAKSLNASKE